MLPRSLKSLPSSCYTFLRYCSGQSTSHINQFTVRTHNCGELRSKNIGDAVELYGWVNFKRVVGSSMYFVVLRDAYGMTQAIIRDKNCSQLRDVLDSLTHESVLKVRGIVVSRGKDINPDIPTGDIEINVDEMQVLNHAPAILPLHSKAAKPKFDEHLELKYRYLTARKEGIQRVFRMRSSITSKFRHCFEKFGFVEIETPTLSHWTPGGANEFIVPSPKPYLGYFYSLPQSPQVYKQFLMIGGFDRYYQIARCYRDEGAKGDRQPEFTQVDFELSFTSQEKVMELVEELIESAWPTHLAGLKDQIFSSSFPVLSYAQAMRDYGSDKPDLRIPWKLIDCPDKLTTRLLSSVEDKGDFEARMFIAKGIVPHYTNSQKKKWIEAARAIPNSQRCDVVVPSSSMFGDWDLDIDMKELRARYDIGEDDAIVYSWGEPHGVELTLGRLRDRLGEVVDLKEQQEFKFLWITDFPLFIRSSYGVLESAHHPFTAPIKEHDEKLWKSEDLENIIAQHYDLVLNGVELGGGSIRIHDSKLQKHVFDEILKLPSEHFKPFLEALSMGAPPHGGFALGLDRFVAILANEGSTNTSIRDVIIFPKSHEGRCSLMSAPNVAQPEILSRYAIKLDQEVIQKYAEAREAEREVKAEKLRKKYDKGRSDDENRTIS